VKSTMLESSEVDVVVVGGGPVGLTVAIDLASQGIRPVLLESKADVSWSSRAICISRRSQEIFERIGVGPAFAAKALPWSRGRTFNGNELVFRLQMPHSAADRHAPFINIQQFHTERFLLDKIQPIDPPSVDVRWGHRVTGITQNDRVDLEVASPDGTYHLRAKWVVAADGGRSTLREGLGLTLRGSSYEGRYLIADIEVREVPWPVERHVWFNPVSNPGSTVILHIQPDGIWRIDIQLGPNDQPDEALDDAHLIPRLQAQLDMMGVRAPWRLVWKSVYRAHALTLDAYRHGRVLFAGDAAHLVPIFGVRGLNSGIDDAHNLSWKLGCVVRGESPEELLDSYTAERLRATHENLVAATKSTWFMSPPSAGFRLMRDAVLGLSREHEWASELLNPRQSSAHTYDASPIVARDEDERGVKPGATLPNVPVELLVDGKRQKIHLQDVLAPRQFSLLVFAEAIEADRLDTLINRITMAMAPIVITAAVRSSIRCPMVIDESGALGESFAAKVFPLYLVRPDEHIAARLREVEVAAVMAALDRAMGRAGGVGDGGGRDMPIETNSTVLERTFEALANGIDASKDRDIGAYLSRLCMLLAHELGDPSRVRDLAAKALRD
jgi:3-(3-hydroxy-phenyl)propionate hydroxylase